MPNTDSSINPTRPSTRSFEGRLLALDLGTKRVGVAVCDELQISIRTLPPLNRRGWKDLLKQISALQQTFDAQAMVIGLPLKLDGSEGDAAQEVRRIARNLSLSLPVIVYLQDERFTSQAAETFLRDNGLVATDIKMLVDSEAAAIILRDFLGMGEK